MLKNFKKNNLYTCKQLLMMAYEGSESTQDNFGKFIYQLQPKTKTLVWKLERIIIKLYRQNVSLLFNQTYLNEGLLPNYTHTHMHIHTYIYIHIYIYIYIYIKITLKSVTDFKVILKYIKPTMEFFIVLS